MTSAVDAACRALGLTHGPIHAECRVNEQGVFVLEVAARPIGGICARALRFKGPREATATLEALLLRHAIGERVDRWTREPGASGVMMIPIPGPGVLRGWTAPTARGPCRDRRRRADGQDRPDAGAAAGRCDLPGIHLRARRVASEVESALRTAHACLEVRMDRAIPVSSS